MPYVFLALGIVCEVAGTIALKELNTAPSRWWLWLPLVIGYPISFYCFSVVAQHISIGAIYAIWSGAAIILVALFGSLFYRQLPDLAGIIGIVFIIVGIAILRVFSQIG